MSAKRARSPRGRASQRKSQNLWVWGAAALVVLVVLGFIAWRSSAAAPKPGQAEKAEQVSPDRSHVAVGTDPGPYLTDPPTSGRHYPETLKAGFYDVGTDNGPYPAGYLVHNLEHGYVIFWYNCSLLDAQGCTNLKQQIQGVLDQEKNFKVIAYPWPSLQTPVELTSWGRSFRMTTFDAQAARDYVLRNRNKSPEPDAP